MEIKKIENCNYIEGDFTFICVIAGLRSALWGRLPEQECS